MSWIDYHSVGKNSGAGFCKAAIYVQDLTGGNDDSCKTTIDLSFQQGGDYHIQFTGAIEFADFLQDLEDFVKDMKRFYHVENELQKSSFREVIGCD